VNQALYAAHSHTLSLCHTHTLSLCVTHTHTHTLSLPHTHTLSVTHTRCLCHTHALSNTLSLSLSHAHSLSVRHTLTHTVYLSATHTHSQISFLSPFTSLPLSLPPSGWQIEQSLCVFRLSFLDGELQRPVLHRHKALTGKTSPLSAEQDMM
jgi:hypothetical protein